MLHVSAAAVHAIRQTPVLLLLDSLELGRGGEPGVATARRRLAAAERELLSWSEEGRRILDRLRQEGRDLAAAGQPVDLAPLIEIIEERIAQDTRLLREARRRFEALIEQVETTFPTEVAAVRRIACGAADLMAREVDALSDLGLAYRALQAELGGEEKGPSHEFSDPAALLAFLNADR